MNDNTNIAGKKTIGDWKEIKLRLNANSATEQDWKEAYTDFLFKRVDTRYLQPINAIGENISVKEGKGFSIVAICCSLMEFFESLMKGYEFKNGNYYDSVGNLIRSTKKFNPAGAAQPLSSSELFVNFLTGNRPFSILFPTEAEAILFYKEVRCAILHQAQTDGNWLVRDGSATGQVINRSASEIILNWKALSTALESFVELEYKPRLINDKGIQENFIFKWDKICQI